MLRFIIEYCQRGEIGRHDGFKIHCLHGRGGSSPPAGTSVMINLMNKKERRVTKWGFSALHLLLVLFILGGQFIDVQHNHNGEHTHQLDCSACVTQNNETEFLFSEENYFFSAAQSAKRPNFKLEFFFFSVPPAKSRSPPVA